LRKFYSIDPRIAKFLDQDPCIDLLTVDGQYYAYTAIDLIWLACNEQGAWLEGSSYLDLFYFPDAGIHGKYLLVDPYNDGSMWECEGLVYPCNVTEIFSDFAWFQA
jgi:hypothetical protein